MEGRDLGRREKSKGEMKVEAGEKGGGARHYQRYYSGQRREKD